jgi:hypothetical protein
LGGFTRLTSPDCEISMKLLSMTLRQVAFGFTVIFVVYGLGLAIVGIGIFPAHILAGLAAIVVGSALATYGVSLAVDAHRGRFPDWVRDIPHSAPL